MIKVTKQSEKDLVQNLFTKTITNNNKHKVAFIETTQSLVRWSILWGITAFVLLIENFHQEMNVTCSFFIFFAKFLSHLFRRFSLIFISHFYFLTMAQLYLLFVALRVWSLVICLKFFYFMYDIYEYMYIYNENQC